MLKVSTYSKIVVKLYKVVSKKVKFVKLLGGEYSLRLDVSEIHFFGNDRLVSRVKVSFVKPLVVNQGDITVKMIAVGRF